MKKTVLLTNFKLTEYGGSEVDTFTIAKYFCEKGYKVDVFTTQLDGPAIELFSKIKIKIITLDNLDDLNKKYDYGWIHHFPMLNFLILNRKVSFNKIIYVSLSSYLPIEFVPSYYDKLNIILANSYETKEMLTNNDIDAKTIKVFPNYASIEYFKNKKFKKTLKKICIVSNHIPDELKEFKDIAENKGLIVDIYGIQGKTKFIDDKVLSNYDLIISIGKTVNYAIALRIPVYCYDRFGGPGYINKENIEKAYYYNFSGRGFNIKKNSEELFEDVTSNYNNSLIDIDFIHEFGLTNFCLEKNIKEVMDIVDSSNNCDIDSIIKNNSVLNKLTELFFDQVKLNKSDIKDYKNKCLHLENLINNLTKGYETEIKRLTDENEEIKQKIINTYETEINRLTKEKEEEARKIINTYETEIKKIRGYYEKEYKN